MGYATVICLVIATVTSSLNLALAKNVNEVTCGSVVKLMNTAFKVRLHSHDIKYGTGSGQQSVTGSELKEDTNSHWAVKGIPKKPCQRGEPILCGSKIRLQHLQTERNLHSHLFSSPLSGHQEISAFGENGEGDTGDIWEVHCNGVAWRRDEAVKFHHPDTDAFLSASGNTYGRPISGQMEIVGLSQSDSSSYWQTMEGVFVHPTEFSSGKNWEHNEL